MLKVGAKAPEFTLLSTDGESVSLKSFRGKKVVLYFYPKDDTPGCTKEACNFRDHHQTLKRRDLVILGVSPDSVESHNKFRSKYNLPFTLLSDPDHKVASAYGAWGKKKLYGREYDGILRSTFIIDEKGTIEHIFDKVKVDTHAEDVLSAVSK
jgi:peroxiredoxin Q/BCP